MPPKTDDVERRMSPRLGYDAGKPVISL